MRRRLRRTGDPAPNLSLGEDVAALVAMAIHFGIYLASLQVEDESAKHLLQAFAMVVPGPWAILSKNLYSSVRYVTLALVSPRGVCPCTLQSLKNKRIKCVSHQYRHVCKSPIYTCVSHQYRPLDRHMMVVMISC